MRIERLLCVLVTVALTACGGGDGDSDSGVGRMDSGGGVDTGTVNSCVHTGRPLLDPETFPPCPDCMGGHCIPSGIVPMEQRDLLAPCDDATLCVPDVLIETGGDFLLPTCVSIAGAEGRCLSLCIPQVSAQASLLPQGTCGADERCSPCFDPTSGGADTGACDLACDTGPTEPPVVFDMCCGGRGTCVPSELVPPEQVDALGEDTCTAGAGFLCAPLAFIDPDMRPMSCSSTGGGEGRCVPDCVPQVTELGDFLPQDICADGEKCTPCFDPRTGEDTGICNIGDDMPVDPPFVFPSCCDVDGTSQGTCVPMELVPMDRRSALDEETCPMMMGYLCVPNAFLEDPDAMFPMCVTEGVIGGGDPGACVLECLVGGLEALILNQATCAMGELCAPCSNPFTGAPTGACS